jgi:hypothetical protein
MAHPQLGHFIQMMREEHLRHQTQAVRLLKGLVEIQKRKPHVIASEQKVINAKEQLQNYLTENNNIITIQVGDLKN